MNPVELAQAGGWATVIAIIGAVGLAFIRGWIVPRFVYDREVTRADRLEQQLDRNTAALETLTDEVRRRP